MDDQDACHDSGRYLLELLTISCDLACMLAQTIGAVLLIRDQGLPVLQGSGVVLIHDVQRCQWFASSYTFPFLR
jgi:hypothetical protein